jgi:hypothetical protein
MKDFAMAHPVKQVCLLVAESVCWWQNLEPRNLYSIDQFLQM